MAQGKENKEARRLESQEHPLSEHSSKPLGPCQAIPLPPREEKILEAGGRRRRGRESWQ